MSNSAFPSSSEYSLLFWCCSSVTQLCRTLQPHELQPTRLLWPSLFLGHCSNSCPLTWWCHPIISSSVDSFSSCPQSFPAPGSFPLSQLLVSGGQTIGASASASVLPMNFQGWLLMNIQVDFQWIFRWTVTVVIIHSDFGGQEKNVCHSFHCSPIYLPWSDGTGCLDLGFVNVQFSASFLTLLFHLHLEALQFLFTFCHKACVICISEVIDISPCNLDFSLCFIQPSVSHDVLCI